MADADTLWPDPLMQGTWAAITVVPAGFASRPLRRGIAIANIRIQGVGADAVQAYSAGLAVGFEHAGKGRKRGEAENSDDEEAESWFPYWIPSKITSLSVRIWTGRERQKTRLLADSREK